jgi:hypothetical protein
LIVTPAGEDAKEWHRSSGRQENLPWAMSRQGDLRVDEPLAAPAVEIPDVLWKQWMASDLQDVVGIHFHEFITDDIARILYTVHKVPPDGPDGKPPAPGSYSGRAGTRIEATLLAPLAFSLDQAIVVRKDPLRKELAQGRIRHEAGHAELSQRIFLDVLRGSQDWNLEYCKGLRTRLEYYWKRERIGRSWDGYRGGVGKVLTQRTTVVLVPPTRWSLLLPIPPERVQQRHIQAFNDGIVLLDSYFAKTDRETQRRFHARHGAFEKSGRP